MFSAHYLMKLLQEAGMPPGVINFVAGDARMISKGLLSHRDLAGVHFTGSTDVFNDMWKTIGGSMSSYRSYPRIVGETGGKDFIVAHPSADPEALATAIVRGGFEFQGQKCSAVSRVYVPQSLWAKSGTAGVHDRRHRDGRRARLPQLHGRGDRQEGVREHHGVHRSRARSTRRSSPAASATASKGYFIRPTLVQTDDPGYKLLCEEIFGPVVTAYVYDDAKWEETLATVDATSPYALTGAVFAQDRAAVRAGDVGAAQRGRQLLHQRQADRRGGRPAAVRRRARVGHQRQGRLEAEPGALGVVPRTVKENFNPPRDYRYPFMAEE